MLALAIALALVVFVVLLLASPASTHTDLRGSNPEAGASLSRAPTSIRLAFSQDVAPEFVRLSLTKGDGGSPHRLEARVNGSRVDASVPKALVEEPTGRGSRVHWRVDYRVLSADGHPIEGSLSFTTPTQGRPGPSRATETPREPGETDSAAGRSNEGDPTPSQGPGTPVISTLVIGALVATAGLGAASWLSRARKRGEG